VDPERRFRDHCGLARRVLRECVRVRSGLEGYPDADEQLRLYRLHTAFFVEWAKNDPHPVPPHHVNCPVDHAGCPEHPDHITPVYRWLAELFALGASPRLKILETVPGRDERLDVNGRGELFFPEAKKAEDHWIEQYRMQLYNATMTLDTEAAQ
jgi:hypothetical protein